jgi:hypothetical protein
MAMTVALLPGLVASSQVYAADFGPASSDTQVVRLLASS